MLCPPPRQSSAGFFTCESRCCRSACDRGTGIRSTGAPFRAARTRAASAQTGQPFPRPLTGRRSDVLPRSAGTACFHPHRPRSRSDRPARPLSARGRRCARRGRPARTHQRRGGRRDGPGCGAGLPGRGAHRARLPVHGDGRHHALRGRVADRKIRPRRNPSRDRARRAPHDARMVGDRLAQSLLGAGRHGPRRWRRFRAQRQQEHGDVGIRSRFLCVVIAARERGRRQHALARRQPRARAAIAACFRRSRSARQRIRADPRRGFARARKRDAGRGRQRRRHHEWRRAAGVCKPRCVDFDRSRRRRVATRNAAHHREARRSASCRQSAPISPARNCAPTRLARCATTRWPRCRQGGPTRCCACSK